MSAEVHQFTAAEFDEKVVKSQLPVLVDFWAPWCGPCRLVAPVLEDLAPEYEGKIAIGKLNVDENPSVAEQFRVTSIPTLILFKDGVVADRIVGAMPKPQMQQFIDRNL